jgi:CubicO group peptidase (beta-lactamase class C family)
VNKSAYEQMLIKTICGPLGMPDTREYLRREDSARFATGYTGGKYQAPWNFKALMGAGGMRSTAADLIKYAGAQLGKAPTSLNKAIQLTHAVTFKSSEATVALAWHMIKPGNDELLFHNGATGGYHSYLAVNLQKKFAVVLLGNSSDNCDGVGNELMKWLETGNQ